MCNFVKFHLWLFQIIYFCKVIYCWLNSNVMQVNDQVVNLKRDFFCFRNGVISSALRQTGDKHKYIMGCMLPDIINIASKYEQSPELACALWNNSEHRECRIAAAMLYPAETLDYDKAMEWCNDVENHEIADILCHRLLRNTGFASRLWREMLQSDRPMLQYIALRLLANLLTIGKEQVGYNVKTTINVYCETATPEMARLAYSLLD